MEKTIKEEIAFSGNFLKVQRDTVQLPDGKLASREFIKHPGAAMVIPVLPSGKLLLLDQYRHSLGRNFIEFPAGKRDSEEDTLTTGKRELQEETGYTAKQWRKLTSIHPVIGYSDEFIDLYLAEDLSLAGPTAHEPGEHITLVEFSLDDLIKLVQEGKLTDVKTQIGVFWYLQILSKNW